MERPADNHDEELKLIEKVLGKNKLESPSSNFTHRVMVNLHSMPVASSLSPRNGILLLCGMVVAVTILTILVGTGVFDAANPTISLEKLPDVEITKDLQKTIPLSGKWIMHGLIMLNIVLAFILFDRTVLRPFFNRRLS
ncbi:MAG TPA: hypothetical protein VFE50_22625 [Cyclobacteriaceae bacterium]|nr:hypothetical protein [Cyclobacteriaceae bacterium]